jgi:hypothetical protein
MRNSEVRTDRVLVHTQETATINAPIDEVDIADWLLNLPDAEYQRCAPPDHLAAGSTTTDDGRAMSINVEMIGGTLVIQHYVAEVQAAHHCHMVSLSDVQTPAGWTTAQVIWDLRLIALDAKSCQFTNLVITYATNDFLQGLQAAGQTFEKAAAGLQAAVSDHNRRETPLFATSIERRTLAAPKHSTT